MIMDDSMAATDVFASESINVADEPQFQNVLAELRLQLKARFVLTTSLQDRSKRAATGV